MARGEQDCDRPTWRRMIDAHTFDVYQPDVLYLGGIHRARQVGKMAEAAGRPCLPHSANLSWATVFTIHLMGAMPNGGGFVEWSIEGPDYYPWQYGVYGPFPVAIDGHVQIPEGSGWGVEVRPAWLEQSEYTVSERS